MDFKKTLEYISIFTKDENTKRLCDLIIENIPNRDISTMEYNDTSIIGNACDNDVCLFDDKTIFCETKEHAELLGLSTLWCEFPRYYLSGGYSVEHIRDIPKEYIYKQCINSTNLISSK